LEQVSPSSFASFLLDASLIRDFLLLFARSPALLDFLDSMAAPDRKVNAPFMLPISEKYNDLGTIVVGKIESGRVYRGDTLLLMPNRVRTSSFPFSFVRNHTHILLFLVSRSPSKSSLSTTRFLRNSRLPTPETTFEFDSRESTTTRSLLDTCSRVLRLPSRLPLSSRLSSLFLIPRFVRLAHFPFRLPR